MPETIYENINGGDSVKTVIFTGDGAEAYADIINGYEARPPIEYKTASFIFNRAGAAPAGLAAYTAVVRGLPVDPFSLTYISKPYAERMKADHNGGV
jgi:hypothetical protein